MNDYVPARGMQRIVLLFLALAFAGMTAASLWQRIAQPDLLVPSGVRQMGAAQDEAHTGDREEIGRLMLRVQQNPGDADAMFHLAEHFVQDENWTAAEHFLRKAVVAAPGNPQALYLLGVVLHNQGHHAEAASCLERVMDLRDEPSVRYSLGVLYIHYLQDPERGGRYLRAALGQAGLPDGLAKLIREELDALASQTDPPEKADAPAKTAPEKKDDQASQKR